jgi:hypothetical protein
MTILYFGECTSICNLSGNLEEDMAACIALWDIRLVDHRNLSVLLPTLSQSIERKPVFRTEIVLPEPKGMTTGTK